MSPLDDLTPEERARQLRNPTGSLGLAVADAISAYNRNGNLHVIDVLAISQNSLVLEQGCGTGAMAEVVVARDAGVRYTGVDISATMIDAANERNVKLVEDGRVSFHLAGAEEMPFEDDTFTHAFSIGVAHFWTDPVRALTETRRVLRPGGMMLIGCLTPERAPPFARADLGFHLRDPESWRSLCLEAGFRDVEVRTQNVGSERGPQVIELTARA